MTVKKKLLSTEKIAAFLATTELFSEMSSSILKELAKELKIKYLAGGDVLFEQNEIGDSMYVIMYGFMHVFKSAELDKNKVIATLRSGSVVGEIACLVDVPRTATVYAVRDSILLQMTRETFNLFLEKYPLAMMGITRQCLHRLVSPVGQSKFDSASCFALIPAGTYGGLEDFSHKIVEKLNQYGNTLLLTQNIFDEIHGKDSANTPLDCAKSAEIISWIHGLESKYKFVVYVAEEMNSWALRCIRQADKVLLIGKYGDSPELNELEHAVFANETFKVSNAELALISDSPLRLSFGTKDWLTKRDIIQHYNIRNDRDCDLNRFIRLITGNGLALVMGGGGSTALSHIGLIRALEELNIPIDYISGTSMGALIGSIMALGYDYKSIVQILTNVFYTFSAKIDYTLPVSALLKGRTLDQLVRDTLGEDTMIEDLWQKFFCVSTNISLNELCIHEEGLLWKAVRSTISLPAIFPAVHDGKLIYVDGGILNNLPVDIMEERINGGKIVASALKIKKGISQFELEDNTSSGWYLFLKHILLPKFWNRSNQPKKNFVSIGTVIHNSMTLGSAKHQQKMVARADYKVLIDIKSYGLLNFKPMQEIIDIGYVQAMEILKVSDLIKK